MKIERLLIGTAVTLACASASAQTWDAAAQWSVPSNPNGVWSYGEYKPLSTWDTLSWDSIDNQYEWDESPVLGAGIWENTLTSADLGIAPGQISLNSSYGTAVLGFTAPVTGIYAFDIAIGGTIVTEGGGSGNALALNGDVSVNGTNMASNSFLNNVKVWQFNSALSAGQTVDAYVLSNGTTPGGNTALNFSVNAVPEPGSYLALGIGLIGLIGVRKRRSRN